MLKTGQQVYLRAAPHNTGTVSRVQPHAFRVVYDSPGRKRGHPRPAFWYQWPALDRFATGRPAPQE